MRTRSRQISHLGLVLGATDVIVVGIFAVVRLLTSVAGLCEGCLGCSGGGAGLCGVDFLGEEFRGERREGSYTTLQVVATMRYM